MGFLASASRLFGLQNKDDRAWAAAETLQDLCNLTVDWLEGRLQSQPGYDAPVDIDEAEGLDVALAMLNQCGYLTRNSQEGSAGLGYDGVWWEQLAVVEGFADGDTLAWLQQTLKGTRYRLLVTSVYKSGHRHKGTTVTWRADRPYTRFGYQLDAGHLADLEFDGCSEPAIAAVCAAWQITIHDTEPGKNDLWATLIEACTKKLAARSALVS